ncbi:MAG: hypothetical protein MRERV_94c005, partial [Mycoplasmataceae bacterium RV_VA103A]
FTIFKRLAAHYVSQIKKLDTENYDLNWELEEAEKQLVDYQQEVEEYKKKEKKANKQAQKLNKKLEKSGLNLQNARADKKLWKEKWENDQKIIAKLILKIGQLKNSQVGIKQKNTKLLNKQGKQNQKINNLQGRVQQLQQDNQGLQQQVQQEKNRADNLQVWKDNHHCSGCHVAAHANYDTIKQERDNYKLELDNHVCFCPNICCANGDYAEIKQQRDNYQQQINDHKCPSVDNRELESLRAEVKEKDKQIEQLEQEIEILKDKPPLVGNKQEVERLLGVITEKEQIIKELEIKLQAQPREVMVESGEVAKLKNKLGQQENKIKQLHIIYLILLGVSALVGVGAVRLAGKKRLKRIR